MTLEERIQGLRLRALYRAVELGNASQVCRELGIAFLSMEETSGAIRPRGVVPRPAGVPAWASAEAGSPPRASGSGHGSVVADLGAASSFRPAGAQSDADGCQHDPSFAQACGAFDPS